MLMQANQEEQEGVPAEEIENIARMNAHVQQPEAMLLPGQATPALDCTREIVLRRSALGRMPRTSPRADHQRIPCCEIGALDILKSFVADPRSKSDCTAACLLHSGWARTIVSLHSGRSPSHCDARPAACGCRL